MATGQHCALLTVGIASSKKCEQRLNAPVRLCSELHIWASTAVALCLTLILDSHARFYSKPCIFPELSKWQACSQMGFCFNFSVVHTSTLQDWKLTISSAKRSGLLCCRASACLPFLPTIYKQSGHELGRLILLSEMIWLALLVRVTEPSAVQNRGLCVSPAILCLWEQLRL